jgi:hypothetical protein
MSFIFCFLLPCGNAQNHMGRILFQKGLFPVYRDSGRPDTFPAPAARAKPIGKDRTPSTKF